MQIVDQVSAAEDQDALVPQRRKFFAGIEMKGGGLGFVYAQLHDWNIGLHNLTFLGFQNRPARLEYSGVVQ